MQIARQKKLYSTTCKQPNALNCVMFFNLLDESSAGEIWELPASSSQSWKVCRFVGVNGSPSSGSWSAVTNMDYWIKQITMNKLNTKLKVMKCQNVRVATKIILKDEGHD